jgi:type I restriction enzyme R subunit
LLESVQLGFRDEDTLSSLANRLARLDRKLKDDERKEIEKASGGASLRKLVSNLLQAIDVDAQVREAAAMSGTETPTEEQVRQAAEKLTEAACAPFDNPELRETIKRLKQQTEQIIDTVTQDELLGAGFDEAAKERARSTVETFRKFIAENRDELTALQIFYSQPYGKRRLTETAVRELAEAIARPPYNLAPQQVWAAYEQLEKAKVRGAGTQKLLTNLVSLLRFEIDKTPVLETWDVTVAARFNEWLQQQASAGREFTPEQLEWLQMIREHIANALTIEMEDFENVPFYEKGGAFKVYQLFGAELPGILDELNEALAA